MLLVLANLFYCIYWFSSTLHDPDIVEARKEEKEKALNEFALKNFTPGAQVMMRWDQGTFAGVVIELMEEQESCLIDFLDAHADSNDQEDEDEK